MLESGKPGKLFHYRFYEFHKYSTDFCESEDGELLSSSHSHACFSSSQYLDTLQIMTRW